MSLRQRKASTSSSLLSFAQRNAAGGQQKLMSEEQRAKYNIRMRYKDISRYVIWRDINRSSGGGGGSDNPFNISDQLRDDLYKFSRNDTYFIAQNRPDSRTSGRLKSQNQNVTNVVVEDSTSFRSCNDSHSVLNENGVKEDNRQVVITRL